MLCTVIIVIYILWKLATSSLSELSPSLLFPPVHGEHPQGEPAQLQLLPRDTADAVADEGDHPGHF